MPTKNSYKDNSLNVPQGDLHSSSPSSTKMGTSPSNNSVNNNNSKQLTKEEKLKRRREFHNAVERRRRDLIKERIKDLGVLVPPSLLNPQLCAVQAFQRNAQYNSREINELITNVKAKETKPNKSTILNKSVHYVEHLEYVLEQQTKAREDLERRLKQVESDINNLAISNNNATNMTLNNNDNNNESSTGIDGFNYDSNSGFTDNIGEFNADNFNIDVSGAIDGSNLKSDDPNSASNLFNPDDFFLDDINQLQLQQSLQLGNEFLDI